MVVSIRYIFFLLASGIVSAGATFFLDMKAPIKILLFLIFLVTNFISLRDLSKIEDLRKAIINDSHKKSQNWEGILAGVVLIVWTFQLPRSLTLIESIIWISTNAICGVCVLYIVFKIVRSFLPNK